MSGSSRFTTPPRSEPLAVGHAAPDFELRQNFETSVRLSELLARGPVVLAFYVFDFGDF